MLGRTEACLGDRAYVDALHPELIAPFKLAAGEVALPVNRQVWNTVHS